MRSAVLRRPIGLVAMLLLVTAGPAPRAAEGQSGPTCATDRAAVRSAPAASRTAVLCVVQERAYREGVFLIVDALAENVSSTALDRIEVGVTLENYFGELLGHATGRLQPVLLEPGQEGSLRVVVPFHDRISRLRYRFTWLSNGRQEQAAVVRPATIH